MRKSNGRRIGHAWRKNDKKKKSNKNEGKEAKTEESDDEKAMKSDNKWVKVRKYADGGVDLGAQPTTQKEKEGNLLHEKENVTMCDRRTHTHCIVKRKLEFWIRISQ